MTQPRRQPVVSSLHEALHAQAPTALHQAPVVGRSEWALAAHQTVFAAGDRGGAWRVLHGMVRLDRVTEHGEVSLVQIALPGDVIGLESLCDQGYALNAQAWTACVLAPVHDAQEPTLWRRAWLQQQQRHATMTALRTGTIRARLSHLLDVMGLPWRQPQAGGAVRQALPTLKEVAELVDAKTETVCRALGQLVPSSGAAALALAR